MEKTARHPVCESLDLSALHILERVFNANLPVDIRTNFSEDGFLALKKIPWICDVEKVNLHLRFNRRFAPHFVSFASDFQDQLLKIYREQ